MKCAICGLEVETIQEAMEHDWLPSFYEGKIEHGPVCSSCAETMISQGDDGEMKLKAEYLGKVRYLDGDYSSQSRPEDLSIEIIMAEERKEKTH